MCDVGYQLSNIPIKRYITIQYTQAKHSQKPCLFILLSTPYHNPWIPTPIYDGQNAIRTHYNVREGCIKNNVEDEHVGVDFVWLWSGLCDNGRQVLYNLINGCLFVESFSWLLSIMYQFFHGKQSKISSCLSSMIF